MGRGTRMLVPVIAPALWLSGCAAPGPQVRMTLEDQRALSSQEIHAVYHPAASFAIVRPVNAVPTNVPAIDLFNAVLGTAILIDGYKDGALVRSRLAIEDPAPQIKGSLVAAIRTAFAPAGIRDVAVPPGSDDIGALQQAFGSGLVLDVRTVQWGIHMGRAFHRTRARLIRLADSTVIWEELCGEAGAPGQESLSEAQWLADGGERLKAALRKRSEECAEQLSRSITAPAEPRAPVQRRYRFRSPEEF